MPRSTISTNGGVSFRSALDGEPIALWPDVPDPAAIDIALVAKPPRGVARHACRTFG